MNSQIYCWKKEKITKTTPKHILMQRPCSSDFLMELHFRLGNFFAGSHGYVTEDHLTARRLHGREEKATRVRINSADNATPKTWLVY